MSVKRQQLIDTAITLFNAHGFHAVGIDRIAKEAKVTKKTMYHHFHSKDELILAALHHHDGLFRNSFMNGVKNNFDTPIDRLLGIFDVAHQWFSDHQFYGCIFINAVGEYADKNTPIRDACKAFKNQMRQFILQLATEVKVKDPETLSNTLAILLEGSIVTAQVSGNPNSAKQAQAAARILIDASI